MKRTDVKTSKKDWLFSVEGALGISVLIILAIIFMYYMRSRMEEQRGLNANGLKERVMHRQYSSWVQGQRQKGVTNVIAYEEWKRER
jgi:hypothetical protein